VFAMLWVGFLVLMFVVFVWVLILILGAFE
jgi:hypothetical protein